MENPFPIVSFELPWEWRKTLRFNGTAVYEPAGGFHGYSPEFFVPLGDAEHPVTLLIDAMPGYNRAISYLVETRGPSWIARRAKSRYRPWVLPSNHDGHRWSRLKVFEEHLLQCKLANVSAERVFYGRDLVVHVQPWTGHSARVGPVCGLGLVGVEFRDQSMDWTPVPDYRIAKE